jgi:phosphoribosyl 1,2-cyclic phosphodiesterase
VRIDLCGVRGSTPTPGADFLRYGGHTSSLAITADGESAPSLILDAGTGIRTVSGLLGEQPFIGSILLTHLHWDHLQGLPFFTAADREDAAVSLLLPEQLDGTDAVAVLSRAMSPPHFPMDPTALRGDWSFQSLSPGECQIRAFHVLAREIPHKGGRTFGYRISDGHATLTYMPDHCPTALGDGPDGYGEYHPAALELAANTDLLVHDAQLTAAELGAQGRFGHSCSDYAIQLAERAGARRVLLFHHHPNRTDSELDALASGLASEAVSFAIQGSVLEL